MKIERRQEKAITGQRQNQRPFRLAEHVREVVERQLLLPVVLEEYLRRRKSQETLPPTELLACDEETEEGHERIERPPLADRAPSAEKCRGKEKPDCSPFDEAVLLHERFVPGRVGVREPHDRNDHQRQEGVIPPRDPRRLGRLFSSTCRSRGSQAG